MFPWPYNAASASSVVVSDQLSLKQQLIVSKLTQIIVFSFSSPGVCARTRDLSWGQTLNVHYEYVHNQMLPVAEGLKFRAVLGSSVCKGPGCSGKGVHREPVRGLSSGDKGLIDRTAQCRQGGRGSVVRHSAVKHWHHKTVSAHFSARFTENKT